MERRPEQGQGAGRVRRLPGTAQIELHPALQQDQLRAFHAEHGIATEAWSPLAQGAVLTDEPIVLIAGSHGVSPGIRQNLDVLGFELSDADMDAIAGLDRGLRTGLDSATLN